MANSSQRNKIISLLILSLPILCFITVTLCCVTQAGYRMIFIDPLFQEKLGINANERRVVLFLRDDLTGLSLADGLEKLEQWGEIELEKYPLAPNSDYEMYKVNFYSVLDTSMNYRFYIVVREEQIIGIEFIDSP